MSAMGMESRRKEEPGTMAQEGSQEQLKPLPLGSLSVQSECTHSTPDGALFSNKLFKAETIVANISADENSTEAVQNESSSHSDSAPQVNSLISASETTPSKVKDLILAEAKERYKYEIDRNTHVHTRVGVYLGILAVYINALVRFIDTPPQRISNILYLLFVVFCILFFVSILVTFSYIIRALLPKLSGYQIRPSVLSEYESLERKYQYSINTDSKSNSIEETLEAELKTILVNTLSEAIDLNFEQNNRRFLLIVRSSYSVAVGFSFLLVSIGLYALLTLHSPPAAKITSVRLVEPVTLLSSEETMKEQTKPANSNAQPSMQSEKTPTTTGSISKPVPPRMEIIKDGYDRPRNKQ